MDFIIANPLLSLTVAFGIAVAILGWLLADLRRKWNAVFGQRTQTNADILAETLNRLQRAERRLAGLEPRVDILEAIGTIAVQKVGFLRFNPFADTGGDQSFALTLLDRDDNGVVISSLYTREGVRVYAKEIRGGASKHPLSEEEEAVLAQAMAPALPRE